MMGLPWPQLWDEVQRANMAKERAKHAGESKRGSALDVVKPEGWVPPDVAGALSSRPRGVCACQGEAPGRKLWSWLASRRMVHEIDLVTGSQFPVFRQLARIEVGFRNANKFLSNIALSRVNQAVLATGDPGGD